MINQNSDELAGASAENAVPQKVLRNQKSGTRSFKLFSKRNLLEGKREENPQKNADQTSVISPGCKSKSTSTKMPLDFFRNLKKRIQFKSLAICKSRQKVKQIEGTSLLNNTHQNSEVLQNSNRPVSCLSNDIHESENTDSSVKSEAGNVNISEASSSNENALEQQTPQVDVHGIDEEENRETEVVNNPEEGNNEEPRVVCSTQGEYVEETMAIARPVSNNIEYDVDVNGLNVDALPHISDAVTSDSRVKASLTTELLKLSKYGWYWGPISGEEADAKLISEPDGAFLVRDSSDDRYVLTLSFKSSGKLLHARMEHSGGLFSLCNQSETEGFTSVAALINHSMNFSQSAVFCYSRPKYPGYPSFPVRLTKPVSRFTQVRSLQYLCRFVIRQNTRVDNIHKLPLPRTIKGYIEEAHY